MKNQFYISPSEESANVLMSFTPQEFDLWNEDLSAFANKMLEEMKQAGIYVSLAVAHQRIGNRHLRVNIFLDFREVDNMEIFLTSIEELDIDQYLDSINDSSRLPELGFKSIKIN